MREVKLGDWLPTGWTGTADFLFFDPSNEAWVLADLKTTKGESYRYLRDGGAKEQHIWQVSAYWHALVEMGLPMLDRFAVIYLPKNNTTDKHEKVDVLVTDVKPLDEDLVYGVMEERWEATEKYLDACFDMPGTTNTPKWINEHLAPVQERLQKMWWSAKIGGWEVKLAPHWSAAYCDFEDDLCDCSEAGTTKIGTWYWVDDDEASEPGLLYTPRKGYESIEPELEPNENEVKKRGSKSNGSTPGSAEEGDDSTA